MRVTRGHTNNRRSHHGIVAPRLSQCGQCGEYHLRHRMCAECGSYKGSQVRDLKATAPEAETAEVVEATEEKE